MRTIARAVLILGLCLCASYADAQFAIFQAAGPSGVNYITTNSSVILTTDGGNRLLAQ